VVGIDGGGLDDLLGLVVLGRERKTGKWLCWAHAWAHQIVLERRLDIVSKLRDFEKEETLTIVPRPGEDVAEVADIICRIEDAGLLAEKHAIGVDSVGIGDIVSELTSEDRGLSVDRIVGISQGWKLSGAIKTTERAVAAGKLVHDGSAMMTWCVGNAKAVATGNATSVTKAVSGSAKIDPVMALFNAVSLMMLNPEAAGSAYEDEDAMV
jgi:phage terminase large subunit-like protein